MKNADTNRTDKFAWENKNKQENNKGWSIDVKTEAGSLSKLLIPSLIKAELSGNSSIAPVLDEDLSEALNSLKIEECKQESIWKIQPLELSQSPAYTLPQRRKGQHLTDDEKTEI